MQVSVKKFMTDKPSMMAFSLMVGRPCMYRYHRPSLVVTGTVNYVSHDMSFVEVSWDDGKVSKHNLNSI